MVGSLCLCVFVVTCLVVNCSAGKATAGRTGQESQGRVTEVADQEKDTSRSALQAAYGRSERWTADGGYATPAEWLAKLLEAVAPEVDSAGTLPAAARFAFQDDVPVDPSIGALLRGAHAGAVLAEFSRRLGALERTTPEPVTALFKELRAGFKEQHGLRGREVMMTVRAALTGQVSGPCLEVVVCLLGRQRCLERVCRRLKEES